MSKRKLQDQDEASDSDSWTKVGNRRNKRTKDRSGPASFGLSNRNRIHKRIMLYELQNLALNLLGTGKSPPWATVRNKASVKQVVVLMVPGLEIGMFSGKVLVEDEFQYLKMGDKYLYIDDEDPIPYKLGNANLPAALEPLADIFLELFITANTVDKDRVTGYVSKVHSPIHKMLTVKTEEKMNMSKSFPDEPTGITEYLLDLGQQQKNGFVVHPAWFASAEAKEAAAKQRKDAHQSRDDGWVDTDIDTLELGPEPGDHKGEKLLEGKHVLALDCEFVKGHDNADLLAHISVLDFDGKVLVNKFVKPGVPVKDYVTKYSGVTEEKLRKVKTTLADVQQMLTGLITPKTILIGHSLESDLKVLKMTHPYLIDTTQLYPHQNGSHLKQSLKFLSQKYLRRSIQTGSDGHDSTEDAKAALELVKQKLVHGPKWGVEIHAESIFTRLERVVRPDGSNMARKGAVVDWGEPERGHGASAHLAIGCTSDAEVVENIERAIKGQAECKDGTTDHVDFVWGRLRELELARKWWTGERADGSRATDDVEDNRQTALRRLKMRDDDVLRGKRLGDVVASTVSRIVEVYESLPQGTALIVYSGVGDYRELRLAQEELREWKELQAQGQGSRNTSASDELWNMTEAQSKACEKARLGVAFINIK